jgi:probable F420-dependent oxidoreductase
VKFGFLLPTCMEGLNQPPATIRPADILRIAREAEALGLDSLWANDHLAPWRKLRQQDPRPYAWYEILVTTAWCASVTTRIKLGLGVIVVPFRDPLLLAKQLATLDALSGGRVLFGVGIGTVRDEFEILQPRQKKASRGAMLDESLEILALLLGQPEATFSGEHYAFEKIALDPKPVQKPFPLYISGQVSETLHRVATWATGLMVMGCPPAALRTRLDALAAEMEKAGRKMSELDVALSLAVSIEPTHERAVERFRNSQVGRRLLGRLELDQVVKGHLIGTPEAVAERIVALGEAGMTHTAPQHIAADRFEEMVEQMHRYAEDVVPRCRGSAR